MIGKSVWNNILGFRDNNSDNCQDSYNASLILVYLLLPIAGLLTLWLRKEFFTKILIHIDELYLPVSCPTLGKNKIVLNWAKKRLPAQWSSQSDTLSGGISDFWKDGTLLCTLVNTVVPGACPNPYGHWKKPPVHGQDVAYKYLGIKPVNMRKNNQFARFRLIVESAFTDIDFLSNLTPFTEIKLFHYLYTIYKTVYALEKQKIGPSLTTPQFVVRGMGLYSAEQFKESEFFIYSKYENYSFFDIEIVISGPYSAYYKTTVLEHLTKERKMKNLHRIFKSSPQSIQLEIDLDRDRLRVGYTSKHCGIHEITLKCNKDNIVGSPFYVNVINYSLVAPKYLVTVKKEINNIVKENMSSVLETKMKKITPQIMEISKYLKELNNFEENKVNNNTALVKRIKTNKNVEFFSKENYSNFQQLADNSFRVACSITRACRQNKNQFFNTSPVCSQHIASEDHTKLEIRQKQVLTQKLILSGTLKTSINSESFLLEHQIEPNNKKPLIISEVYKIPLENSSLPKKSLQTVVSERKLFWEHTAKKAEAINKENFYWKSHVSRTYSKNTDSLYFTNKITKSKTLSDLSELGLCNSSRFSDDNLEICGKISLENRLKAYLQKAGIENDLICSKKNFDVNNLGTNQKLLINPKEAAQKVTRKQFKEALNYFQLLEANNNGNSKNCIINNKNKVLNMIFKYKKRNFLLSTCDVLY